MCSIFKITLMEHLALFPQPLRVFAMKMEKKTVEPPFTLSNSQWCSVCSLTNIEYASD